MQPHKIIRSKRKTIALQINENAELIVRAPYHASQRLIGKFIDEKQEWILNAQNKAASKLEEINQNREFKDGKRVMYLGLEYEIRLNGRINNIELDGKFMEFPFKKLECADSYLEGWYKKRAKEIIAPQTEKHAKAHDLTFAKIGITSAKRRWGSCNNKGSINFSYRLVMTPPEVIDYVIVHELMHLKEMNHSAKFWAHVEQIIPEYKKHRKWLRDNQHRFLV